MLDSRENSMQQSEKNFRRDYSDSELDQRLKELSYDIERAQTPEGNVNIIPLKAPLIQIGLAELQKRSSNKTAFWSRVLAFISILVAFIALFISYQANMASSKWEEKQLRILEKLTLYQQQSLDLMTSSNRLSEEMKQEPKVNSDKLFKELQNTIKGDK